MTSTTTSRSSLIERDTLIDEVTDWLLEPNAVQRRLGALLVGRPGAGTSSAALAVAARLRLDGIVPVLVHDVHRHQDEEVVAVFGQAESDGRPLVVTARAGAELPASVARRWSEGSFLRVDVEPLSEHGVAELAEELLGARPALNLARPLHEATDGLPLYLREMIAELVSRDEAKLVDDVWVRSVSRLSAGPRLVALVRQRIAVLNPGCRQAIESIAVAGALPVAIARTMIPAEDLEQAEATGLLRITPSNELVIAPPIVGEAIERSLSVVSRFAHHQQLLASVPEQQASAPLLIRMGQWLIDDQDQSHPALLVRASEMAAASGDFPVSGRLARSALDDFDSKETGTTAAFTLEHRARARLVAARALRFEESPQLSVQALEPVLVEGDEGDVLINGVSARVRGNLLAADAEHYTLGQYDQAMNRLAKIRNTSEGASRRMIDIELLIHQAYSGRLGNVLAALEEVESDPGSTTPERVAIAGSLIMGLLGAGRGDEALRVGERSLHLAMVNAAENPVAVSEVASAWGMSQMRLLGPSSLSAVSVFHEAEPKAHVFRYDDGISQLGAGLLLLEQGFPARALEELLGAISVFRITDPSGFMAAALAGAVQAAVCSDRAPLAEQLAQRWYETPTGASGIDEATMGCNLLWYRYIKGGSREVEEMGLPYLQRHIDNGMWGSVLQTRHTMLRLGVPSSSADLEPLRTTVRGVYTETKLQQLRGVAEQDGERLLVASESFERLGSLLIAAECAAQASEVLREESRPAAGRRAAARVRELRAILGPVTTPILGGWKEPVELTRREQQVADLVVDEMSSAEVGQKLGISSRTVEAHLQRIYDKLGVNRRSDLAAVLMTRS